MIKRSLFSLLSLSTITLASSTLVGGLNIVAINSDKDLIATSYESKILKITKATSNGQGYNSYKPGDMFNDFTSLENGKGYIILTSDNVVMDEAIKNTSITENCVNLIQGLNIVTLPTLTLDNQINGASIIKITKAVSNGQGYNSYKPGDMFNDFSETEAGESYIVIADSVSTGTCDSGIENPPETPDLNSTTSTTTLSGPPMVPSI